MTKHISQNKHEFNEREHNNLNELILLKEQELKSSKNIIKKAIIKHDLKKLYFKLNVIGHEIITFENRNINN